MSDLISRKAVEKAIKEYFKMIIDETDDDVDCVLDYNKNLCDTIDEIPVAYDVDKVVNQLEIIRERKLYNAERYLHNGNEFMEYGCNCEISGIDKAIYVINRGGEDE